MTKLQIPSSTILSPSGSPLNSSPGSQEDMREFRDMQRWARMMPAGLATLASGGRWKMYRHHAKINELLCEIAAQRIYRAVIEAPPQHGKSMLASMYFPAWYLGRFPHKRIILLSYSIEYAESWGAKTRDVLAEYGPSIFGVGFSKSASAAGWWELVDHNGKLTGGGMVATGLSGSVTGKGADLLIIDDPLKDNEEAESAHQRQKVWNKFASVAYTRLAPGAAIMDIQTRWHEDDLGGRLLAGQDEAGEHWTELRLPAICDSYDDPLGREIGEALWPEMYPIKTLEITRKVIGAYFFSALYQGKPTPAEGATFKSEHFHYFDLERGYDAKVAYVVDRGEGVAPQKLRWPSELCRHYMIVDPALTTEKYSDYTCMMLAAMTSNDDLLVLDIVRVKMESPDLIPQIAHLFHTWYPAPATIKCERVAFQLSIIQALKRSPYNLPVDKLDAAGRKEERAGPVARRIAEGRVFFRRGAEWLPDFEDELLHFPNGAHDDQVDCLAYADLEKWALNQASIRVLDE